MPVVTLTTDFGLQNYYAAIIKGTILSRIPETTFIDITHNISTYDIVQGAFMLKNAWASFPKQTIHIISLHNFYKKEARFLVFQYKGHYFIGPDNGIFSLMFDELPAVIYVLKYGVTSSFPLKELYANAVSHICSDKPFSGIGTRIQDASERITFQPVITESKIKGSVIYIDNYQNVVVNINRFLFEQVQRNRDFELYFKRHDPISTLSENYYDVPVGEPLCLFNSANYLEIAINSGKAASLLGLKLEDPVQVEFQN